MRGRINLELPERVSRPARAGLRTATVRRTSKALVRSAAVATAWARPWPQFLIIGTKRGGTTSLYRYLESHPAVLPLVPSARFLPLQGNSKGVRYFDTGYAHSHAWYRSHFPTTVTRRLSRGATGVAPVTGEASPYYLFHPHAPARAGEVLGDARIIVILRDPVERAHSHHAERRANGVEPLTFEEALAAEADRLAGEQERLEEDPSYRSFAHEHQSYVAQGRYADSVARWRKHFPPEQLLILCSEELFADPEGQLRRVHAFLGLPHRRPPDLSARNPVQRELMPAALRHELEACFASDFRRLERLVDRTFPWSSSGGPATDPEDLGGLQPTTGEGRLP